MLLAELHERVHGILAEVRDLVLEREAHCDGPAQQRGRLFADQLLDGGLFDHAEHELVVRRHDEGAFALQHGVQRAVGREEAAVLGRKLRPELFRERGPEARGF